MPSLLLGVDRLKEGEVNFLSSAISMSSASTANAMAGRRQHGWKRRRPFRQFFLAAAVLVVGVFAALVGSAVAKDVQTRAKKLPSPPKSPKARSPPKATSPPKAKPPPTPPSPPKASPPPPKGNSPKPPSVWVPPPSPPAGTLPPPLPKRSPPPTNRLSPPPPSQKFPPPAASPPPPKAQSPPPSSKPPPPPAKSPSPSPPPASPPPPLGPDGPCSSPSSPITIRISSVADLAKRLDYSNTTTVTMLLTNNITLSESLMLNASFSCTVFRADPALRGARPFFVYPRDDQVGVRMQDLVNFRLDGIGVWHEYNRVTSVGCDRLKYKIPEFPNKWICPGVYVYRCFNTLILNAFIHGRVDVARSASTEISYSYVEHFYDKRRDGSAFSPCTVRFILCGDPFSLVPSNNRLTNNELVGGSSTVIIHSGAVGVNVSNNYIHGQAFSGLQCGMGDSSIADCMLNVFERNYIFGAPPVGTGTDQDGTGVYYSTHWYGPGNRDICNYVEGGAHCFYVDFSSSGVSIEGAVCLRNHDGVKMNTGKFNKVKSVVIVEPLYQAGILSCQNWCLNSCGVSAKAHATFWWTQFEARFKSSPVWRQRYPELLDLCGTTKYINIPCNPSPPVAVPSTTRPCSAGLQAHPTNSSLQMSANATLTGNCSGIPALNTLDLIVVNQYKKVKFPLWPAYWTECEPVPNAYQFNTLRAQRVNLSSMGFNDEANDDFGADDKSAPIYKEYPDFKSCPRQTVGIQASSRAQAAKKNEMEETFNRSPPSWYHNTYDIYPFISDGTVTGGGLGVGGKVDIH